MGASFVLRRAGSGGEAGCLVVSVLTPLTGPPGRRFWVGRRHFLSGGVLFGVPARPTGAGSRSSRTVDERTQRNRLSPAARLAPCRLRRRGRVGGLAGEPAGAELPAPRGQGGHASPSHSHPPPLHVFEQVAPAGHWKRQAPPAQLLVHLAPAEHSTKHFPAAQLFVHVDPGRHSGTQRPSPSHVVSQVPEHFTTHPPPGHVSSQFESAAHCEKQPPLAG